MARSLLSAWGDRFQQLVMAHEPWCSLTLLGRDRDGRGRRFRGPDKKGQSLPVSEVPTFLQPGALGLVGADTEISLWPLCDCSCTDEGTIAQIYTRRGELRLEYTPLGGNVPTTYSEPDAVEVFQKLFYVETRVSRKGDFVPGFESEIQKEAERRVGRDRELEVLAVAVRNMLKEDTPRRRLWLHGSPGMGKSNLVAALVVRLLDDEVLVPSVLILPYRFRAGDSRNDRELSCDGRLERLEGWEGLSSVGESEELSGTATLEKRLAWVLGRVANGRQVLFVLDGLDEIAERDASFVHGFVMGLPGRRVAWMCAGRPERALAEVFADARQPFPDGLSGMCEEDVRALLLDRLSRGRARNCFLSRDDEREGRIHNAFLERLVERSEGVPIYLNHVIGDLQSGRLTADQEAQLPKGLAEYHERLLERAARSVIFRQR